MSPRHTDATPGWIKRRFAKLEKQMREDRSARRLQSASIGRGGLTVKEGGTLTATYPNGQVAVQFGPFITGGETTYGLFVYDDAGNLIWGANHGLTSGSSAFQALTDSFFTGDFFIVSPDGATENITLGGGLGLSLNGGSTGVQIAHSTTGASANCFIDPSDGRIWRSTSSRRYKQDIEDVEVDPAEVLQLRARTWRDKGEVERDPETETRYTGLIAEEVDEHPTLRQFVTRKDGEAEAVDYDRLSTVGLLAVLKDQQARIEALEASVNEGPAKS